MAATDLTPALQLYGQAPAAGTPLLSLLSTFTIAAAAFHTAGTAATQRPPPPYYVLYAVQAAAITVTPALRSIATPFIVPLTLALCTLTVADLTAAGSTPIATVTRRSLSPSFSYP